MLFRFYSQLECIAKNYSYSLVNSKLFLILRRERTWAWLVLLLQYLKDLSSSSKNNIIHTQVTAGRNTNYVSVFFFLKMLVKSRQAHVLLFWVVAIPGFLSHVREPGICHAMWLESVLCLVGRIVFTVVYVSFGVNCNASDDYQRWIISTALTI